MSQNRSVPYTLALVVEVASLATFASVPERRAQEADGTPLLLELTDLLVQIRDGDSERGGAIHDLRGGLPAFIDPQEAIDDRSWQIGPNDALVYCPDPASAHERILLFAGVGRGSDGKQVLEAWEGHD